jgi:hypothetical protein
VRKLIKGQRIPLAFAIVVTLCVAVLGVQGCAITQNRDRAREGAQAHDAICALKGNLADRITASEAFLRERPNGIDGLSPSLIQDSINRDKTALDAMSPVKCTPTERNPTP